MNELTLINGTKDKQAVSAGPIRSPFEVLSVHRGWLNWDDERTDRWSREKEPLAKLVESMKMRGAPTLPLLVAEEGSCKFRVIDGVGRVMAGDQLKLEEYEAYVINDLDVAEGFLSLNVCRFDVDPVTLARHLKQLQLKTGYSHEELGEIIGKSRETVTQILPIADLPIEMLSKALAMKPLPPLSHFIQLAAAKGGVRAEVLTKITEGARRSDIRKLLSSTIDKPRPFKRAITAMIKRVDDAADILSRLGQDIGCNEEDVDRLADLRARIEQLLSSLVDKCKLASPLVAGEQSEALNKGGRDE